MRLDHSGIAAILKSAPVRSAIDGLTEDVAARVRASAPIQKRGIEGAVEVESYTTDRAAGAVLIRHAAGRGMEAKHGVLTQAAGDVGLEVRSRE